MDETQEAKNPNSGDPASDDLINAFIEITSSSHSEAFFFLESHNFDLDAAVSTFLESTPSPASAVTAPVPTTHRYRRRKRSTSSSPSPYSSPERSPSRSRSDSPSASVELELPPVNSYNLRSRRPDNNKAASSRSRSRAVQTTSDANLLRSGDDSGSDDSGSDDSDEDYFIGGEESGILLQDASKVNDVEALFNQARHTRAEKEPIHHLQPSSRSRSFSGKPRNKRKKPFQGTGKTLGSTTSVNETEEKSVPESSTIATAPPPPVGPVVDQSMPSTSIQLRLINGTRLISRFNFHHTISDIRSFIDASRGDEQRDYQLQIMGFPPKQLTDLNQTIEEAGLANTVVIQKL